MNTPAFKIEEDDISLRIFISEREKLHGRSMYEAILMKARELGLAGATILRGVMGFGADKHLHTAKLLDLSDNLPMVIEIVDREENISLLMPFLDEYVKDGFVTMEKVHVVKYRREAGR